MICLLFLHQLSSPFSNFLSCICSFICLFLPKNFFLFFNFLFFLRQFFQISYNFRTTSYRFLTRGFVNYGFQLFFGRLLTNLVLGISLLWNWLPYCHACRSLALRHCWYSSNGNIWRSCTPWNSLYSCFINWSSWIYPWSLILG